MIRVNLLNVGRRTKWNALTSASTAVSAVGSLLVLTTAISIGWWWWSLHQTAQMIARDLARAEAEKRQLQPVVAQVQQLETRRAALQQRVTLVEQTRSSSTSSGRLLAEIAEAVPDRLWLVELATKETELTLTGLATTLSRISQLVANLEASPRFRAPVEILDTQRTADPIAGELVKFSVKATIVR